MYTKLSTSMKIFLIALGIGFSVSAHADTRPTLQDLQNQISILKTRLDLQLQGPGSCHGYSSTGANRFQHCGEEVIVDGRTGLFWKHQVSAWSEHSTSWYTAMELATQVNLNTPPIPYRPSNTFIPGGWRLPTKMEFEEFFRDNSPVAIVSIFGADPLSGCYWSSTYNLDKPDEAFAGVISYPSLLQVISKSKEESCFSWLVRGTTSVSR